MRVLSAFSLIFYCLCALSCTGNHYVEVSGYAQGGTYSVKFNTRGMTVSAQSAANSIDSILTLVDTTLSGYNKGSMISRYNGGETIVPNEMFRDIFALSRELYTLSDSTVDVTAAPLFDLWGFGFTGEDAARPARDVIDGVRSRCGMQNFSGSLEQAAPGQKLNYNAIAQGYTCDLVARYLYSKGVKDMLVDIGEIFCDGLSPSGKGWRISIDTPLDGNNTPGESSSGIWQSDGGPHGIVTSGNYRKFFVVDGQKYSHTIDPRTGYPVSHNLLSATIIAKDAATADAMATACMVMGLESASDFVLKNGYGAVLIYDEAGSLKTRQIGAEGFTLPLSR